jgi:protein-L-isoaspartate(D-aspartate) O-methyltransferase
MGSAFDDQALATVRRAYAHQMLALAGISHSPRLEEAFASVPRERFLGPPPWQVSRPPMGYQSLPSTDPVIAYQDALFALAPDRGVNNGSPSLHARWLHALAPGEGERIAHIGAGTGYYTALIAHLVGETGHVMAIEFDPALAEQAKANLAACPNVSVVQGDGASWPQEKVDGVYVNFSVERPVPAWIDNLRTGGRLVFPLGVPRPKRAPWGGFHALHGAGLCATRLERNLSVRWLGPAYFVCAEGLLSERLDTRESLKASFERGGIEFVRSLIWREAVLPDRCWHTGAGWALSYDEAG